MHSPSALRRLFAVAFLLFSQGMIASTQAAPLPTYIVLDLGDANLVNGTAVDRTEVGYDYLPRFDASGNVTRYLDQSVTAPALSGSGPSDLFIQTYASGKYTTGWTWPNASGTNSGFVSDGGRFRAIGTNLTPFGVNQNGDVVGATGAPAWLWNVGSSSSAFLYTPGQGLTSLGTLGGSNSAALAISNTNQVVGTSQLAPTPSGGTPSSDALGHAFLSVGGAMTDLNGLIPASSGWTLLVASDINDRGQILGQGLNSRGQMDYFLLMPFAVPEPISLLGFGIPFAFVVFRQRTRLVRGHAGT